MAITKYPGSYDGKTSQWTIDRSMPEITYVGRVLEVYRKDYRAMSDVYTTATFARVVEDDGVINEHLVNANFECDVFGGHAEPDATPECLAIKAAHDASIEASRRSRDEKARKTRLEEERNRPTVGKRMEVFRGRKVPLGTTGTVAYVSGSGSVLLKDDAKWQDRKVDGVWVPPANLRARA